MVALNSEVSCRWGISGVENAEVREYHLVAINMSKQRKGVCSKGLRFIVLALRARCISICVTFAQGSKQRSAAGNEGMILSVVKEWLQLAQSADRSALLFSLSF